MPSFTIKKKERKHIGIGTLEALGRHCSQDSNANTAWASGCYTPALYHSHLTQSPRTEENCLEAVIASKYTTGQAIPEVMEQKTSQTKLRSSNAVIY